MSDNSFAVKYDNGQFFVVVNGVQLPVSDEEVCKLHATIGEALQVLGYRPIAPAYGPLYPPEDPNDRR